MAADYIINKIYVCSPYHAEYSYQIDNNKFFATEACKFVMSHGKEYMPIAPHLLYPQLLNDDDSQERAIAISYCYECIMICSEVWVFGDKLSEGMAAEVAYAHLLPNKKIRFFRESEVDDNDDADPDKINFEEIKP